MAVGFSTGAFYARTGASTNLNDQFPEDLDRFDVLAA
jgi:hypothetical protein